jgi:hypothetical protein
MGRRGGSQPRLQVVQGSLSARKVERQAPWLANLHRITTGAITGISLAMVGLSGLTLYWQNEWARSYAELQASKELEHRMQESSALLEQHHMVASRQPGQLVPTSSEKLIHLPEPKANSDSRSSGLLSVLRSRQIPAGY